MPEKELQFNKPEEVERKPEKGLKERIEEVSSELKEEGVPVDEKARINMDKFVGFYGKQVVEQDKKYVRDLKEQWRRAAISDREWGPFMKEKALRKQTMGEVWETLTTVALQENLKKDFIVVRTSEHDDVRNGVDNVLLDRKTGNIVCGFDAVEAISGKREDKRFEEKKDSILKRNWEKGGAYLKYGISLKEEKGEIKFKKGHVHNIPLFYFAISEEDMKKGLKEGFKEKEIFNGFVRSLKDEQIDKIKERPLHPKLQQRLDLFENYLEKFK